MQVFKITYAIDPLLCVFSTEYFLANSIEEVKSIIELLAVYGVKPVYRSIETINEVDQPLRLSMETRRA